MVALGRTDGEGGRYDMTGWQVGLALGIVVVLVAALIVIVIVRRSSNRANEVS